MDATPLPAVAPRYSPRARHFHWWMFAFVALAYLLANLVDQFGRGTPLRTGVLQSHFLAGLVVLALVLPRLLHRLRNVPPPIVPPIAGWEATLSRITHIALYAFLLLQPLLGLVAVWYRSRGGIGIPGTHWLLPSPLSPNHDLSEQVEGIHKWIGTAFYYVIGLHILGALWHHFVRKDSTLRRMV